jgi:protein-S-isoprenylcysteine O-methyltransferase Ste14
MIWHFERLGKPTRAMMMTAVLAAACCATHITTLSTRHIAFPHTAIALFLCSLALFWWAVSVTRGKLAACGQGCISATVLENGPYSYIRHPFYSAYNLTWLAGFVASGWWPTAVTAVIMAILYERFAREEEKDFLASGLAPTYRSYKQRVGRYLPRIGAGRVTLTQ